MESSHSPLISIGVPIFNGARFLERALASLLDQSVSDFEVIISDNASTDETQRICEGYAERDPRVRYIRHKENMGAPKNWNFLVHEAQGNYFKWAAAGDFCAPSMLEQCLSVLRRDPRVVLCYGLTRWIDEYDNLEEVYPDRGFEDDRPSDRYANLRAVLSTNNMMCGVFRLDILRRTQLNPMYPSGDLALMAEAVLYGRFRLINHVLLFRRRSPGTSSVKLTPLGLQQFHDPKATSPLRLILMRHLAQDFVSILRAPIATREKARAYYFAMNRAWRQKRRLLREMKSFTVTGNSIVRHPRAPAA